MRLTLAVLLAVLALPAAAAPRPETVYLGGERLAVFFPNGVICRTAVGLTGGAGRLDDCPYTVGWQVAITKRNYLEPLLGAAVSPYAVVTLTDDIGRTTRFRTPPILNRDLRQ